MLVEVHVFLHDSYLLRQLLDLLNAAGVLAVALLSPTHLVDLLVDLELLVETRDLRCQCLDLFFFVVALYLQGGKLLHLLAKLLVQVAYLRSKIFALVLHSFEGRLLGNKLFLEFLYFVLGSLGFYLVFCLHLLNNFFAIWVSFSVDY